jgi:hypothetical protein
MSLPVGELLRCHLNWFLRNPLIFTYMPLYQPGTQCAIRICSIGKYIIVIGSHSENWQLISTNFTSYIIPFPLKSREWLSGQLSTFYLLHSKLESMQWRPWPCEQISEILDKRMRNWTCYFYTLLMLAICSRFNRVGTYCVHKWPLKMLLGLPLQCWIERLCQLCLISLRSLCHRV